MNCIMFTWGGKPLLKCLTVKFTNRNFNVIYIYRTSILYQWKFRDELDTVLAIKELPVYFMSQAKKRYIDKKSISSIIEADTRYYL